MCDIAKDVMVEAAKYGIDKAVGKPATTLGDLFNSFLLATFHEQLKYGIILQNDLDTFKMATREKVDSIPDDKKIEPKLEIIGPAIENSKYHIKQDDLRGMFSNLIASSVNLDLEPHVHPSFAEIIKQMSPLDAQLLSLFKGATNALPKPLPVCQYLFARTPDSGQSILLTNVFLSSGPEDYDDLTASSLENLKRLGMLSVEYDKQLFDESLYLGFESTPTYKMFESELGNITIKKGVVKPTPLGVDFIKVCL